MMTMKSAGWLDRERCRSLHSVGEGLWMTSGRRMQPFDG